LPSSRSSIPPSPSLGQLAQGQCHSQFSQVNNTRLFLQSSVTIACQQYHSSPIHTITYHFQLNNTNNQCMSIPSISITMSPSTNNRHRHHCQQYQLPIGPIIAFSTGSLVSHTNNNNFQYYYLHQYHHHRLGQQYCQ